MLDLVCGAGSDFKLLHMNNLGREVEPLLWSYANYLEAAPVVSVTPPFCAAVAEAYQVGTQPLGYRPDRRVAHRRVRL